MKKVLKNVWNLPEILSSDKAIKYLCIVAVVYFIIHIIVAII